MHTHIKRKTNYTFYYSNVKRRSGRNATEHFYAHTRWPFSAKVRMINLRRMGVRGHVCLVSVVHTL